MKKLLAALMICATLLCCAASADAAVLTVEGSGVVTVTANAARIVLGVQVSSADVTEAQALANGRIDAICAALVEAGIPEKEISTQSLYIYENYDYETMPATLTGYTVSNTMNVNAADIDKVGSYIDIAFTAGATTLNTIEFIAVDTDEARDEALILAVESARGKAEVLAEAMGMELGAVLSVREGGSSAYNSVGARAENMRTTAAGADTATQIRTPELQISAGVTIEFELIEGES